MKKILTNMLSVLLTMSLVLTAFMPMAAFSADSNRFTNANHVRLLNALGITIKTGEVPVSRGELAIVVADAFGLSGVSFDVEKFPYKDVSATDDCYNAVGVLCQAGILSASDTFNPNGYASSSEVAKMIVSALGYDYVAQARGGYPVGYIVCANDMDISVDNSASVSGNELVDIIFEALEAKPNYQALGYLTLNQGDEDGFSAFHNIDRISGIFTSNHIASIYKEVGETKDKEITIDGERFKISDGLTDGQRKIDECLGSFINAYVKDYDGKNGEIIYFDTEETTFTELSSKDVVKEGFALSCSVQESVKEYKLSPGYSVILNGRLCTDFTDDEFSFIDGTLLLIDNNSDRKYDVVRIMNPEYLLTENFDSLSLSISDKNRHSYGSDNIKMLELTDEDAVYEFYMYVDGKCVPCIADDLESYNSFEIIMSRDRKYISLTGFSNSISGTIDEISKSGRSAIVIMGNTYFGTSYFDEHISHIPLGSYVTATLTPEGNLISIESDENTMRYGYLMKIADMGGLEGYRAALLTDLGSKETVKFRDSIILDGNSVRSDFGNTSSVAYTSLFDKPQLIKYSINTSGELCKIDTAVEAPSVDEVYSSTSNSNQDDSLTMHSEVNSITKQNAAYITCFAPSLVPRAVKIFVAPPILNTANAHLYEFNINDFDVINIEEFPKSTEAIKVYDISRNRDAGAIVLYSTISETSLPALDSHSTNAVIDRITTAANEDGEIVKKITYVELNAGKTEPVFMTGTFSNELQDEYERLGYDVKVGDFVSIARSGNTITNIRPRISYRDDSLIVADSDIKTKFSEGLSLDFIAKGTVLDYTDVVLSVLLDDDDLLDGYDNARVVAIPTHSLKAFVRFNKDMNCFEKITPSELKTAYNTGLDEADRILVRTGYLSIFGIAVYAR